MHQKQLVFKWHKNATEKCTSPNGNYGLVERNKSGINNYYVKGEFLSALIGRSRYGTNHWLDTQYWMYEKTIWKFDIKIPASIDNHGMKAVKEALN